MIEPGTLRIVGGGHPFLVAEDVRLEVAQADGSWTPLRYCAATIRIRRRGIITVAIDTELSCIEADGLLAAPLQPRPRWLPRRAWTWLLHRILRISEPAHGHIVLEG